MYSIAGKRCLITGGSRGIGLAIAQLFAREGASVTLVGRSAETLTQALGSLSLSPRGGGSSQSPSLRQSSPSSSAAAATSAHDISQHKQHSFLAFDVSSPEAWRHYIREPPSSCNNNDDDNNNNDKAAATTTTPPTTYDILVNAAGVSQNSLLASTKPDDVRQLLDINLLGTILGCQAVVPRMMRQKSGCIINVSSLLAVQGGKGASVYAASKAGIVGLTRSLASEVGRFQIRANVLLPGYIETEMTKGMNAKEQISSQIPLGRLGRVEEVADAAAFLARNPYAHNCVLNLDGGLSGV